MDFDPFQIKMLIKRSKMVKIHFVIEHKMDCVNLLTFMKKALGKELTEKKECLTEVLLTFNITDLRCSTRVDCKMMDFYDLAPYTT